MGLPLWALSAKVYGSSGYRWIILSEVVPYSAMPYANAGIIAGQVS